LSNPAKHCTAARTNVRAAANYYKAIKNRQQDFKRVHYLYPAGYSNFSYSYPAFFPKKAAAAVHGTAAHWIAAGLWTNVRFFQTFILKAVEVAVFENRLCCCAAHSRI
jgi:hypothetical protein